MQTTKCNAPFERITLNMTSETIGCIFAIVLNIGLAIMFVIIG
jgi:hypothetical protein